MKFTKSRTLKNQLTETVALWGICFFLLLGLGIYAFFQDIETFLIDREARQHIDTISAELFPLLQARQNASIQTELKAYTHIPAVAAVVLLEDENIVHVATDRQVLPLTGLSGASGYERLTQFIRSTPSLSIFSHNMFGDHQYRLMLVMDNTAMTKSLTMTTEFSLVLMMLLLLISIKALHFVLGRRLIGPVNSLRSAMENSPPEDFAAIMPQEITQAMTIYEQLQQRHDVVKMQFLNLMEALPGCFWWSEDAQNYTGISDKADALLSHSVETLTSAGLWSWLQSPAQARINRRRLQLAIDNQEDNLDFAYQVNQGEQVRWFGETVTLIYNPEGRLVTIYGTINDISNRKERQKEQAEKIELAQRMKATATLVGGIAHEFNNALAGMNGNLFLIRENPDDIMTSVRIERIEKLIDQAATMIEQMLAFSLQSNLVPKPVVIDDFLKRFQHNILPALPADKTFKLLIQDAFSSPPACTIYADANKLQEALMQLLNNAIEATAFTKNPEISIHLSRFHADSDFSSRFREINSKDIVHLSFSDNGCGMSEDVSKRIFEPFFTTREVGKGTGLGLPMVYGYVKQIGGCIDVESNENHGTTFHLYLPVEARQEDQASNKVTHGHKETILIIDDEDIFLDSCCDVLKELGYLTIAAHNGEEAIHVYQQHKDIIQLVITDIIMPGISGVDVYRRIQKLRPGMPFLFITAYDQTYPHAPEIFGGNCEVLEKPFHIPALSHAIDQAIQSRKPASAATSNGAVF